MTDDKVRTIANEYQISNLRGVIKRAYCTVARNFNLWGCYDDGCIK